MVLPLRLLSFDVFGTLISVREGSYGAFEQILREAGAPHVDVKAFWEAWEERNIAAYWQPYRPYKQICRDSLAATFDAFGISGRPETISATSMPFQGSSSTRTSSRRSTGWRNTTNSPSFPTSTTTCSR